MSPFSYNGTFGPLGRWNWRPPVARGRMLPVPRNRCRGIHATQAKSTLLRKDGFSRFLHWSVFPKSSHSCLVKLQSQDKKHRETKIPFPFLTTNLQPAEIALHYFRRGWGHTSLIGTRMRDHAKTKSAADAVG